MTLEEIWEKYFDENDIAEIPHWAEVQGRSMPIRVMIRQAFQSGYRVGFEKAAHDLADEMQARARIHANKINGYQSVIIRKAYDSTDEIAREVVNKSMEKE